MSRISFTFILTSIFFFTSCQVNKKIKKNENLNGISLEANHIANNEFKLVYNSLDTISTTLIINKKVIEKSKVKSVLDTIKLQKYRVDVNKEKRIIELISF